MTSKHTIVVCLFDQKSGPAINLGNAKVAEMKRVRYAASDIVRYCARLKLLPGPYTPTLNVPLYITRDGEVGAVAFQNFQLDDLAGMTRELEHDALVAPASLSRPWIHGCISIDVSPADYEGEPDDLLDMGHSLMKMFGVNDNRYMLAVHMDSGSIHVHFLYSRVDATGALRERDRKMPKFMAEEATALLAHQFGFSLAPHHLSRVTPEGVFDLASDRVVRDLTFNEIYDGMKSRNTARKKTKHNELLTLALVARHEARNLHEFRSLLAPFGITYEKNGSGAEFQDCDGRRVNASEVDHKRRFTPTNMFDGALLVNFPRTPDELRQEAERIRADAMLAQHVQTHANLADGGDANANMARDIGTHIPLVGGNDVYANMASAKSSDKADGQPRKSSAGENVQKEIDRFFADRGGHDVSVSDRQGRWDKAAMSAIRSTPGRPTKDPILPGWPSPTKFHGSFGSRAGGSTRVRFSDTYEMLERTWQTEVWREGKLVASIRYSRMAIVSTKEDDLREALRAAQRAWGSVEIFGRPKFKKQMARLAAEMNIPVSNPELQEGMARIKKAMAPAVELPGVAQRPTSAQAVSSSLIPAAELKPPSALVPQATSDRVPTASAAWPTSTTLSGPAPQTTPGPLAMAQAFEVTNGGQSANKSEGALDVQVGDNQGDRSLNALAKSNADQRQDVASETRVVRGVGPRGPDPSTIKSQSVLRSVEVPSSVPSATIAPEVSVAIAPITPTATTMPIVPIAPIVGIQSTASKPPGTPATQTPPTIATMSIPERKDDARSQAVGRDVLPGVIRGNWPIRPDPQDPSRMTLYENEIRAFRVDQRDLKSPQVQARLTSLYRRQQAELNSLAAAVRDGTIRGATQSEWKGGESVSLRVPDDSPFKEIYRRCALHPQFATFMKVALSQCDAAREAALRVRATEQAAALNAAFAASVRREASATQLDDSRDVHNSGAPARQVEAPAASHEELTGSAGKGPPGKGPPIGDELHDRRELPASSASLEDLVAPTNVPTKASERSAFPEPLPLTKEEIAELLRPRTLPDTREPVNSGQEKQPTLNNAASKARRDAVENTKGTPLDNARGKPADPKQVSPQIEALSAAAALSR